MYDYRQMTDEQRHEVVAQRASLSLPWHRVPHCVGENQTYIVTGTCFNHCDVIESDQRRAEFAETLQQRIESQGTKIFAWCVLPNHCHLLLRGELTAVEQVLGRLHGATSRSWNLEEERVGRQIWYGCSDRIIRSERHFYVSMNYIHNNAVKHGYAERALLWPNSSVHFYLEAWGARTLREMWIQYPVRDYGKSWDW